MTLPGWRALFERMGLEKVTAVDFSETLADMESDIRQELGLWGGIRMAAKLAFHRELMESMLAYRKLFQGYIHYIGYGYFVGRKPEPERRDWRAQIASASASAGPRADLLSKCEQRGKREAAAEAEEMGGAR
jgi:hypothetical protein